jgi:sigma54-dependent transcription regulator
LAELGIFIGSAVLRDAAERAAIAADSDLPVLLQGEAGTGKELFARLVHRVSRRHARPLVPVNCAAIPKDLVESHLFGHVKGAFTGAASDQKGTFEQADGGTLFLDEIGELTVDAQAKLLRVLQDGIPGLLNSVATAKSFAEPALGLGKDIRIMSDAISGAALWAEMRFVHVCAFHTNGGSGRVGFRTRMSRPTHRRQR